MQTHHEVVTSCVPGISGGFQEVDHYSPDGRLVLKLIETDTADFFIAEIDPLAIHGHAGFRQIDHQAQRSFQLGNDWGKRTVGNNFQHWAIFARDYSHRTDCDEGSGGLRGDSLGSGLGRAWSRNESYHYAAKQNKLGTDTRQDFIPT